MKSNVIDAKLRSKHMDTTLHMMSEPLTKVKVDSDDVALFMHVVADLL